MISRRVLLWLVILISASLAAQTCGDLRQQIAAERSTIMAVADQEARLNPGNPTDRANMGILIRQIAELNRITQQAYNRASSMGCPGFARLSAGPAQPAVKPSDVFFFDAAHPDQRSWPYNANTSFAPKNQIPAASVVARGVVLRGWLQRGEGNVVVFKNEKFEDECKTGQVSPACGTRFLGYEDVHYFLDLDPDFIRGFYGANTSAMFKGAALHGNPIDANTPTIGAQDMWFDGLPLGVDINSFWLPYTKDTPLRMHTELNAWHARRSQHCSYVAGQQVMCDAYENYAARGAAPAGWVERDFDHSPLPTVAADNWWPFDPDDPDGLVGTGTQTSTKPGPDYAKYQACFVSCAQRARNSGGANCGSICKNQFPNAFVNVTSSVSVPQNLHPGDYVEMRGTLWQDVGHRPGDDQQNCWNNAFHNYDGWLEIHPVDSIQRVQPPFPSPEPNHPDQPPFPVAVRSAQAGISRPIPVALCTSSSAGTAQELFVCPEDTFGTMPARLAQALVPHVEEIIDARLTDPNPAGLSRTISNVADCAHIQISLAPGKRFKTTYVVSWTPQPIPPMGMITSFGPAEGPATGGGVLSIRGSGLGSVGTRVLFGTVPVTPYPGANSMSIQVSIPPNTPGSVPIQVLHDGVVTLPATTFFSYWQPTMKISMQSGTDGVGARKMNWVTVTAVDFKTGKPVNGTVTIATYSEAETTSTDSSGKVHRVQQLATVKGVCAPPNATCNSGPTGTKVYYRCSTGGDCVLSVNAPGYTGAEVTLR